MKVLYIGGTGTISASSVRESVRLGMDVHVLNRGRTVARRPLPPEVTTLTADISDPASVRRALAGGAYDCVLNFLAFGAQDTAATVDLLADRTGQYIHIGSASAYHKPVRKVPFTESTTLRNPYLAYARDKIAAEKRTDRGLRGAGLPGHDRAPLAHLRRREPAAAGRLDGLGPGGRRRGGRGPRGRHQPVDAHPRRGPGRRALRPDRQRPGHRGGLPHHLRRGPALGRDLHARRPCRGHRGPAAAPAVRTAPRSRAGLVLVRPDRRRPAAQRGLRQLQDPPLRAVLPADDHLGRGSAQAAGLA